jgi:methionyl-tRNA formyltransferase/glycosyltransferase involved in cell wall biosynthesis
MSIEVCALGGLGAGDLLGAALRSPKQLYGLLRNCSHDFNSCTWRRRIGSALKAAAIARRYSRVDHLHAHFLGAPALTAYYLACLLQIPYSLSAHAHDIYAETTPSLVLTKASFRTTCTKSNVQFLAEKEPSAPFTLVRHGIDARYYAGVRTPAPGLCRLLAVGRHVEKKGFQYLVDACAFLQSRGFSFHCKIIGEGPLLDQCRHRALAIGVKDIIEFRRFLPHDELQRAYLDSDILVVPSILAADGDRDGVPNVILEAMATGLPVIATDAGAIGEAIEHRRTGLLLPQMDAAAIAKAVSELWSDPRLRESLIEAALQDVRLKWDAALGLDLLEEAFDGKYDDPKLRIGYIGTGLLGRRVLDSLLKSHHDVAVTLVPHSRTRLHVKRISPSRVRAWFRNAIRSLRSETVKATARRAKISVIQVDQLGLSEANLLKGLELDLILVAGCPLILKSEILSLPKLGCMNIHPSLLPKFAGPAPITAVLLANEHESGVTFHKMTDLIDGGDIYLQRQFSLAADAVYSDVEAMSAKLAASSVVEALGAVQRGQCIAQDHTNRTYIGEFPEDSLELRWTQDATAISAMLRAFPAGMYPRFSYKSHMIRIVQAHVENVSHKIAPGTILTATPFLRVAVIGGVITIRKSFSPKCLYLCWPLQRMRSITAARIAGWYGSLVNTLFFKNYR